MKERILNVAGWLEHECDPKQAAKELRIIADEVERHISALEDQRDDLYTQVHRLQLQLGHSDQPSGEL